MTQNKLIGVNPDGSTNWEEARRSVFDKYLALTESVFTRKAVRESTGPLVKFSRWSPCEPYFQIREGWLAIARGGEIIAVGYANAFRSARGSPRFGDFVAAADNGSLNNVDMTRTLRRLWKREEAPWDYGAVVHLQHLAVKPGAHGVEWAPGLLDLANRIGGETSALMLLKAQPLEYDFGMDQNAVTSRGNRFRRKQAALIRIYDKMLGFQRCNGVAGQDGWMWRATGSMPGLAKPRHGPVSIRAWAKKETKEDLDRFFRFR